MRPGLVGKGLGLAFVDAGLAFAKEQFKPDYFRLFVLTFNERAIKVYERAGFQRVGIYMQHTEQGERDFLEMSRKAYVVSSRAICLEVRTHIAYGTKVTYLV